MGFSIVEALVGMLVFSISAVALYGGIMSGISTIRMARENQRATQIMVDVMEMVRLYSWDQINTTGYVPSNFVVDDKGFRVDSTSNTSKDQLSGSTYLGRITISNPPLVTNYSPKLKLVTVELAWRTGGLPRYRKLSTLVALDGLFSYIY